VRRCSVRVRCPHRTFALPVWRDTPSPPPTAKRRQGPARDGCPKGQDRKAKRGRAWFTTARRAAGAGGRDPGYRSRAAPHRLSSVLISRMTRAETLLRLLTRRRRNTVLLGTCDACWGNLKRRRPGGKAAGPDRETQNGISSSVSCSPPVEAFACLARLRKSTVSAMISQP
jgi:hypothetical protein